MSKKINPEEIRQMLEHAGGIEEIMKDWGQFKKDNEFLDSHAKEWLKEYPDKWIAVYKEELVAIAEDYAVLLNECKRKGVPTDKVVLHFLSTKKISWILEKVAV